MENPFYDLNPPQKTLPDRIQALIEVLLISGLVSSILVSGLFSLIPGKSNNLMKEANTTALFLLIESGIIFLLLAILLNQHRERLQDLGLSWNRLRPNIALGIMLVPLLFIFDGLISFIFKEYFPKHYIESNPLTEMIHTPGQLALFIFAALVAGGIKEELQRAFILNRFRQYLGGAGLGLIIWSAAFGAGHSAQHIRGVVAATLFGILFGLVYLIRRSLIAPIVAHSLYDALALLNYWFFTNRAG